MTVSLIILGALLLVGGVLYAFHRRDIKRGTAQAPTLGQVQDPPLPTDPADEEVCCGMHITCERDSLLASVSPTIEYYDDEELDVYRGRDRESYDEKEIEEFRDVLLTMPASDIAGWARSLQLRGVELPSEVRDELLMIVAEARRQHA